MVGVVGVRRYEFNVLYECVNCSRVSSNTNNEEKENEENGNTFDAIRCLRPSPVRYVLTQLSTRATLAPSVPFSFSSDLEWLSSARGWFADAVVRRQKSLSQLTIGGNSTFNDTFPRDGFTSTSGPAPESISIGAAVPATVVFFCDIFATAFTVFSNILSMLSTLRPHSFLSRPVDPSWLSWNAARASFRNASSP